MHSRRARPVAPRRTAASASGSILRQCHLRRRHRRRLPARQAWYHRHRRQRHQHGLRLRHRHLPCYRPSLRLRHCTRLSRLARAAAPASSPCERRLSARPQRPSWHFPSRSMHSPAPTSPHFATCPWAHMDRPCTSTRTRRARPAAAPTTRASASLCFHPHRRRHRRRLTHRGWPRCHRHPRHRILPRLLLRLLRHRLRHHRLRLHLPHRMF